MSAGAFNLPISVGSSNVGDYQLGGGGQTNLFDSSAAVMDYLKMGGYGNQNNFLNSSSFLEDTGLTGGLGGAVPGGAPGAGGSPNWLSMDGIFGNSKTGTKGWGGAAMGALQGLGSMYMGLEQIGAMKDQLKQTEKQFNFQANTQVDLANTRMRGKAKARHIANPGLASADKYMATNKVKSYG